MTTGTRRAACGAGLAGLLLAALTACGTTASPSSAPAGGSTSAQPDGKTIALSEMKVTMPTTYSAGRYTFKVTNEGSIPHELLVFRSALTPDKYPVQASGAIAEDGAGITKISDGDNLDKGHSQNREVDLHEPGTYLFVCNLPGHFAAHMYTYVNVTS